MSTHRSRYGVVLALLAAVVLAPVALATPASAATARTITVSSSATTAGVGTTVTFSGTATKSPAGSRIWIERRSGTTWVTDATTTTTGTGGAFSVAVTLPSTAGTYGYRSHAVSTKTLAYALSPTLSVSVSTVAPDAPRITTTSLPVADKGLPYEATLAKTGGDGRWTITAGTLPAGVALAAATGVLSGTPTVSGVATFGVQFTETATGLSARRELSLTVTPAPVVTTAATLPDATRNTAYSVGLTKTGRSGSWSVPFGSLPSGLSLSPTGVLSGTPVARVGVYSITPTFTETNGGRTASKKLSLRVGGTAVAITTEELPDAHLGAPYTVTLDHDGGPGTWSSYPLPAGLSLDARTGVLSGTPTVSGDRGVYVGFSETSSGQSATKSFVLHIAVPVVTTTTVPDGTTGTAYEQQLEATGLPGTWSRTNGVLPPGVTLTTDGTLTGTPTTAGDYGFTVLYTETSTGVTDKQALLLHVSDPGSPVISTPNTLPDADRGTAYRTTLVATPAGGTWSVTYGTLPTGLTLNRTTGVISGTPTKTGNVVFIAKYTLGSTSNTKAFQINVVD